MPRCDVASSYHGAGYRLRSTLDANVRMSWPTDAVSRQVPHLLQLRAGETGRMATNRLQARILEVFHIAARWLAIGSRSPSSWPATNDDGGEVGVWRNSWRA